VSHLLINQLPTYPAHQLRSVLGVDQYGSTVLGSLVLDEGANTVLGMGLDQWGQRIWGLNFGTLTSTRLDQRLADLEKELAYLRQRVTQLESPTPAMNLSATGSRRFNF
jgi:hypothetical protein